MGLEDGQVLDGYVQIWGVVYEVEDEGNSKIDVVGVPSESQSKNY